MQTASGTTLGMADFFFLKQPLVVGSLSHISDLLNPGLCCVDKGLGRERAMGAGGTPALSTSGSLPR